MFYLLVLVFVDSFLRGGGPLRVCDGSFSVCGDLLRVCWVGLDQLGI